MSMVSSDYKSLKFILEGLAIDDKIPIKHSRVLKNCKTNQEGNVVMDVSSYDEDHVRNIVEALSSELEVEEKDEELIIYGDFGSGADVAPY